MKHIAMTKEMLFNIINYAMKNNPEFVRTIMESNNLVFGTAEEITNSLWEAFPPGGVGFINMEDYDKYNSSNKKEN